MHTRNKPERFPFQSGCKSTHFTHNFQTLYTIFFGTFLICQRKEAGKQYVIQTKKLEK